MELTDRMHKEEEPRAAGRGEREAAGDVRDPGGASEGAPGEDGAREGALEERAGIADATEEWKRLYGLIRAYTEKMRK